MSFFAFSCKLLSSFSKTAIWFVKKLNFFGWFKPVRMQLNAPIGYLLVANEQIQVARRMPRPVQRPVVAEQAQNLEQANAFQALSPIAASSNCVFSMVPFKQTITIDHFSHLLNPRDPGFPILNSTPFPANQKFSFFLEVRPNGIDQDRADFLSFTLVRSPQERQELDKLIFRLSIVDVNGQKRHTNGILKSLVKFNFSNLLFYYFTASLKTFEPNHPGWGFHNFISHRELLDPANGFLPNDKLTLLCEANRIETKNADIGKLQGQKNPEWMCDLLVSGDQSDVVLVLDDGQEFASHKLILGIASPVFKTMFELNMSEKLEGRVLINNMDAPEFRAFLKYIYTGLVEDMNQCAKELLIAADKVCDINI